MMSFFVFFYSFNRDLAEFADTLWNIYIYIYTYPLGYPLVNDGSSVITFQRVNHCDLRSGATMGSWGFPHPNAMATTGTGEVGVLWGGGGGNILVTYPSHMLHVWNIYLHLGNCWGKFR